MRKTLVGILFALSAAACGGVDNVGSCRNFVEKVKCGSVDISSQVNCDAYANTTCDISDYFDCLSTKYVCVDGMYDTSKLSTAGECAAKATCN